MKKYLLKLIDSDILQQSQYLLIAKQWVVKFPSDEYWIKRIKAQEKKISTATKYRDKILNTF
jgi:hypothetical protein